MQSDLLYYDLRHASLQGARERRSVECDVRNAGPAE